VRDQARALDGDGIDAADAVIARLAAEVQDQVLVNVVELPADNANDVAAASHLQLGATIGMPSKSRDCWWPSPQRGAGGVGP
jgi:hypothetical protein